MKGVNRLTLCQVARKLKKREISVADVIGDHLRAINAVNPELNCFTSIKAEEQLEREAREADERYEKGEPKSMLDGIPVVVKDNFCTTDDELPTTAASKMLRNYTSPIESTPTQLFKSNGAIILGKTNLDEFAMGSATVYSDFGKTMNPWDRSLSPGGSSGGSAAAIAARLAYAGLGSDTGGSVRQPASVCGVVGFKPTYGSISRYGLIAFCSSMDTPGIFCRTISDTAQVLQILNKHDAKDSTSIQKTFTAELQREFPLDSVQDSNFLKRLEGLRVGVPAEYNIEELQEDHRQIWKQVLSDVRAAGASLHHISLPTMPYSLPTYIVLASSEASSNMARFDGIRYGHSLPIDLDGGLNTPLDSAVASIRSKTLGAEVKRRILSGSFTLSSDSYRDFYTRAVQTREMISRELRSSFDEVDCLLTPTTPIGALPHEEELNATDLYLHDTLTVPSNLAGLPSVSIPVGMGLSGGNPNTGRKCPVGMQIIGNLMEDVKVLKIAEAVEHLVSFNIQNPYPSDIQED